ncbi:MAG: class I SAM-dependent methyltransferase [Moorea sp. SIO4G2]|uniref:class I SAM-dependent methyltransferase n=1 Tax=Moorena sp. SIO4A5 TaxID=2607838 RepID=UPI0013C88BBC|nr:class I SAM-dependent methyltransferase [Moorena sp. SIO4A5]NEO21570.1 class I SAM-dependent methyltransferase [Moorena sp. SIO4A5]NEO62981.1 class I SAM-dependent methyltransferase [Moorena sp. SIO4G2]
MSKQKSEDFMNLEEFRNRYSDASQTLFKDGIEYSILGNETQNEYDLLADSYDVFMREEFGWYPEYIIPIIRKFVFPHQLILDAGVGTGLIGQELARYNYKRLWGIDISTQMLEKAKTDGNYECLNWADLYKPLAFEDNFFDAIISIGVLIHVNHPQLLREFVRVTKRGGHIILANRIDRFRAFGFMDEAENMTNEGLWKSLHHNIKNYCTNMTEYINTPDLHYTEDVYQVLE